MEERITALEEQYAKLEKVTLHLFEVVRLSNKPLTEAQKQRGLELEKEYNLTFKGDPKFRTEVNDAESESCFLNDDYHEPGGYYG